MDEGADWAWREVATPVLHPNGPARSGDARVDRAGLRSNRRSHGRLQQSLISLLTLRNLGYSALFEFSSLERAVAAYALVAIA